MGENLINYPRDVGTTNSNIIRSELLFNILLSNTYAKLMVIDIIYSCRNTPISRYEHMRLPIDIIPQEIIDEYQLQNKVKMASSCVKSDGECMEFHRN